MNRGGVGARSLNIEQAALKPAGDRKVERFGCKFGGFDFLFQLDRS